MNRTLITLAFAFALFAAGCAGWITVDGYQVAYVDAPANIERRPHYVHGSIDVYEVDGRFYRRHESRWVVFRERPRDLVLR